MKEKFKDWDIYNDMPKGWKIDNSCGSPIPSSVFITNGESVLSGRQKRALLRVYNKPIKYKTFSIKEDVKKCKTNYEDYIFPAKEVNELARKKFQERLLIDIRADLMVCELEGWDKKQYINEIKNLINSL